jgi:HNH endonuclease
MKQPRTFVPFSASSRVAGYVPDPATGCWNWAGSLRHGYGQLRVGSNLDGTRRIEQAHRVYYEREKGQIPAGLEIDHLCRNPRCVNPAHLEAVTTQENSHRSPLTRTGANIRKTHCHRGHLLTGDNLYIERRGKSVLRHCRSCQREMRKLRAHG